MAKKFPITQKKFREYIHANPKKKFGSWVHNCPVATALNDLQPKGKDFTRWEVGAYYAYVPQPKTYLYAGSISISLPKWARRFISRWDNRKKGVKAVDLI